MKLVTIKKIFLGLVISSLIINLPIAGSYLERKRSAPQLPLPPAKRMRIESESTCSLFATPGDDIIQKILDDFNGVGTTGYVGIESPSFTNQSVISKLVEVAGKGAKVRVFVNEHSRENNPEILAQMYADLKARNIEIIEVPGLHTKRIVIAKNIPAQDQDKIVYLGSLNMTRNSPHNYEIMMRCTDPELWKESFGDQHRLRDSLQRGIAIYHRPMPSIDFRTRTIIRSSDPQAIIAKKQFIEKFSTCRHPHDFLYFAAYSLDDPVIIDALIRAQKSSNKPIKIIFDGSEKYKIHVLKPLVLAGLDVYIFNKDGIKKTPLGFPEAMHIKAILLQCNQECFSFISTANFTPTGIETINYDLWEPCTLTFSEQLKKILDTIIQESEKLNLRDFLPRPMDGTPQEMGQKILDLMVYKDSMFENTDEILRLIRAGADLSLFDEYGSTALIKAAASDHAELVLALIDAGANVNQTNRDRTRTPLYSAVISGNVRLVQALVDAGIAPTLNFSDEYGNTPLFKAISGKHVEVVKILLKSGANPDLPGDYRKATSRWGHTGSIPPLVRAVQMNKFPLVELLLKAGATVDALDRDGFTAFLRAFSYNNIPMIKILAQKGANINIQNPKTGKTALIEAALANNFEMVNALLEAGADVNAQDKYRKTVFDYTIDPKIMDFINTIKFIQANPE